MKKPLIRALFLDFANVCATFDTHRFLKQFGGHVGVPPEEVERVITGSACTGATYGPLLENFECGRITPAQFFHEVTKRFKCAARIDYETFARMWASIFIEENGALGELLAKLHLPKFLLSNTNNIAFTRYIAETKIVRTHFRTPAQRILSCRVGTIKPYPEIYLHAFERSRVGRAECLFIDDVPENIISWKALGGKGIVYDASRDPFESLEAKLREFDIA